MFKPYQAVMVLNQNCDGKYYDVKGTYIEHLTRGSNRGKHKVEVNSTALNVSTERLMDHDEYFALYHSDRSKLPAEAAKELYFMSGDYRG